MVFAAPEHPGLVATYIDSWMDNIKLESLHKVWQYGQYGMQGIAQVCRYFP